MRCPNCGEENPERARFCSSCGAALEEAPRRGGRRAQGRLRSLRRPRRVHRERPRRPIRRTSARALRPYHARVKQEIERFGGTVEKFVGDAVMAVFGAPVSHEDDAERAVHAALRILAAIDELNAEHPDLELAVRGAVNSGEAMVTLSARPAEGEGMVAGDVVNTAARLQQHAPVGGIVVGEGTYRVTRELFEYEPLEPVTAKGKGEALQLWHATAPRRRFGVDVEPIVQTPLIGRDDDLALLQSTYARTLRDASTQLLTITGEPGVGKTRLTAEFRRWVDDQPEIVFWRQGRSLPYGEGITYWALGEMIKAQAGILESDSPEDAAAKLAVAVGEVAEDETEVDWLEAASRRWSGPAARSPRPSGRNPSRRGVASSRASLHSDRSFSSSKTCTGPTRHCSPSSSISWTGRRACRSSSSARRGPSSTNVTQVGAVASETRTRSRCRHSRPTTLRACSQRSSTRPSYRPRHRSGSWNKPAAILSTPRSSSACSPTRV